MYIIGLVPSPSHEFYLGWPMQDYWGSPHTVAHWLVQLLNGSQNVRVMFTLFSSLQCTYVHCRLHVLYNFVLRLRFMRKL